MKSFPGRRASHTARLRNTVSNVIQALEQRLLFAAFTPGDLVVYRVGTGSAALGTASTAVYLDEYTPAGGFVQSIALPTTTSGSNNPLTASGTGNNEGQLTLSQNGENLLLTGYDTTTGTASVTSSATVLREVGVVSASGTVNTTTTLGTSLESGSIYSAASVDGVNGIYASGVKGIAYTTVGSTANANILSSAFNYGLEVNGNQLYASTDTSSPVLATVGSGLPTSGTQTLNSLPGVTFSGTAGAGVGYSREFAFATLNGGTSPDTLYVADSYNDAIDKLSLVSGSWVMTGAIGGYPVTTLASVVGVVAEPVAGGEQLFITTSTTTAAGATSELYTITDPYGYNSNGGTPGTAAGGVFSTSPPLTMLDTSGTNEAFRGLNFVPQSSLTVATQPSPATQNAATGSNVSFFSAVDPGTDATVQWEVNKGSGFTALGNGTDANGVTVSGATSNTLTLTDVSVAESGYKYEAVFTSTAAGTAASNAVTVNVGSVPVISSVSPPGGPTAGGTTVTITGQNLAGATVYFGTPGPSTQGAITADSASSITVTDPAESAGAVNVTVVTSGGTSAISSADQFTYASTPTVSSISPTSGGDVGGTLVTINGTGFFTGATVAFGGVAATNVTVVSYSEITAHSPASSADVSVDVVVTTSLGVSSTSSADKFTYTPFTNADAETSPTGSVVTLDNNPIVTAILSDPANNPVNGVNYTYYAFLVNDGTGSIDIFGSSIDGYTPQIGDALKITGTWSPFDDLPEIDPATTITVVSSGNTIPASYYPNDTIAQASVVTGGPSTFVPQPLSLAGQLVTLTNATITPPAGTTVYGTSNIAGTISDSSDPTGIAFYYYATSYSAANANFDGQLIPTAPTTITGIVDVFGGAAEFVPISGIGYAEKYTISSLSNTDTSTDAPTDQFYTTSRGSNITVTVARTYPSGTGSTPPDIGTVGYEIIPDSALDLTDYTDTDPSAVLNATTGIITGSLNFPANTNNQTFTIDTNALPGDYGDKLFTIELTTATTNNSASSTNPFGYNPFAAGGPATVVINDPNSTTTVSANSIGDLATIEPAGVKTTTTNNVTSQTTATIAVEANNGTTGADASYGLMTYDDSDDGTDVFTYGGTTFGTIDGIELETQAVSTSYETSGKINIYLVSTTITGNNPYPVSSLKFDAVDDPIDGLGTQLGAKYLLGTIQYNTSQAPGGYVPFNLTNLDPTGVSILAADLSTGAPFTIAATPADSTVEATWVGGSSSATIGDTEAPILRIDYTTTLPAWVSAQTNANASSPVTWIQPTNTLAVTGAASIVADPGSSEPIITSVDGASSVITVNVPSNGTLQPIHLGGIALTSGASMLVDSVTGQSSTNHDVLIVGAAGVNVDSLSKLNLTNNDMIVQGAGEAGYGTINGEVIVGRGSNGLWNGNEITSSSAAATPQITALAVVVNDTNQTPAGTLSGTKVFTTFDGQTVGDGDVLVKYTYYGDANLDGKLSAADYIQIDSGFNGQLTGWYNGDFNYDGAVNGDDYTLIDNAYNTEGAASVAHPLSQIVTSIAPVPTKASATSAIFASGIPIADSTSYFASAPVVTDSQLSEGKKKTLAQDVLG